MNKLVNRATELLNKLDFDGCLKLIDKLPIGSPIFDLACDRMEILDSERFLSWIDS